MSFHERHIYIQLVAIALVEQATAWNEMREQNKVEIRSIKA